MKPEYLQPVTQVLQIRTAKIICTSDPKSANVEPWEEVIIP